jgi:hypothetical protein
MTWLLGLLGGLPSILSKGLDYYIARSNGDVQKAIALMQADQALIQARRDVMIAGMSHPIWWLGWALFVMPLGIYWCKVIVWDKVLQFWTHGTTDPLTGLIGAWAGTIVLGLFGLQVGSGLVGDILNRLFK